MFLASWVSILVLHPVFTSFSGSNFVGENGIQIRVQLCFAFVIFFSTWLSNWDVNFLLQYMSKMCRSNTIVEVVLVVTSLGQFCVTCAYFSLVTYTERDSEWTETGKDAKNKNNSWDVFKILRFNEHCKIYLKIPKNVLKVSKSSRKIAGLLSPHHPSREVGFYQDV